MALLGSNGLAIAAGMERAAPESVAHFIVTTIVRVTPLGNQIRYKGRPSRYSWLAETVTVNVFGGLSPIADF